MATLTDISELIVKALNEAQQWQNKALEQLSYLRELLSSPKQAQVIEEIKSELREAIEINNKLLNYFIKQIKKTPSSVGYGGGSVGKKSTQSFPNAQYLNMTYPSRLPMDSATQKLCQDYKAGIENPPRKNEFIQRYNPVRIGVINAMERRREPSIKPIFQTANDGDYYAVAIKGNTLYAVVPRFDLTFQESIYGPGAMGQVFDCPNYNPQLHYRNVKVMKPAFFEPDSTKQHWILKEKGELDWGQGE